MISNKILFLLIAFSAIDKDFVFAANTTSGAKAPINPDTTTSTEASATKSTSTSAPLNNSPETTSAPLKISTGSSAPVIPNNLSIETTVSSVIPSSEFSINVTEKPVEFLIEDEDGSMLTDDLGMIKSFHYVIYDDKTGVPCILTKMGITLTVPYETEYHTIATTKITVPLDANVTGTCEENLSLITLTWQEIDYLQETISDGENSLTMRFKKEGDIFYIQYLVVSVVLDIANFPNATGSIVSGNSSEDLKLFPAPVPLGMHVCNEMRDVQADPILVQFRNISVIAFNNQTDFSEKQESYCASEDGDADNQALDIGAIVGGVLGGIVLLAIIILIIMKFAMRNSSSWNILRKTKVHEGC